MDDKRLNRELDEVLAMLKAIEHKLASEGNIRVCEIKDIFIIHMAVLHGYYDMSDALDFIREMYAETEEE